MFFQVVIVPDVDAGILSGVQNVNGDVVLFAELLLGLFHVQWILLIHAFSLPSLEAYFKKKRQKDS